MRLTLRQPPPNETTPSSEGANEGQRAGNTTLHTSTPPPLARATTKTLTARGGGAPRRNALRPLVRTTGGSHNACYRLSVPIYVHALHALAETRALCV